MKSYRHDWILFTSENTELPRHDEFGTFPQIGRAEAFRPVAAFCGLGTPNLRTRNTAYRRGGGRGSLANRHRLARRRSRAKD